MTPFNHSLTTHISIFICSADADIFKGTDIKEKFLNIRN